MPHSNHAHGKFDRRRDANSNKYDAWLEPIIVLRCHSHDHTDAWRTLWNDSENTSKRRYLIFLAQESELCLNSFQSSRWRDDSFHESGFERFEEWYQAANLSNIDSISTGSKLYGLIADKPRHCNIPDSLGNTVRPDTFVRGTIWPITPASSAHDIWEWKPTQTLA